MEIVTAQLPLKEVSKPYKIVLPYNVVRKIELTCQQCFTLEWSGSLFYTVEGSVKENNLVFTVVDFFIQDKGQPGYTEFKQTPDVPAYMMDNDLLDCNIGLIHSHNQMATFFSGTDTATLRSEGAEHIHFLSLIVNNAGTYTAGVTTKYTVKKEIKTIVNGSTQYVSFDGVHVIDETTKEGEEKIETVDETVLEWTRLEIDKAVTPDAELNAHIAERFAAIEKEKAAQRSIGYGVFPQTTFPNNQRVLQEAKVEGAGEVVKVRNLGSEYGFDFSEYDKGFDSFQKAQEEVAEGEEVEYKDVQIGTNPFELFLKRTLLGSIVFERPAHSYGVANLVNTMTERFKDFTVAKYEDHIRDIVDQSIDMFQDPVIEKYGFKTSDEISILCWKAVERLEKYPINPFLERLIKELNNYILKED